MGGDANVCVRQWVQARHPHRGDSVRATYAPLDLMFPPLDLMSKLSNLTLLTLDSAPLETALLPLGFLPLEVVVSGVGNIYAIVRVIKDLVCHCGFSCVWAAVAPCSFGKGRTTAGIYHGVL